MVLITCGKEIADGFSSSTWKAPLIRLQPALPCKRFSAILNSMNGCFSIPSGIASPAASLIIHLPSKSDNLETDSFFCNTTMGRLEAPHKAIFSFPSFLYFFTLFKADNTLFSTVISGQAIRVLAKAPRSIVPGLAFTSNEPIIRLQPLLPNTFPVVVSKPIKGNS